MSRDPKKFEKPELIYEFVSKCFVAGHTVIITCTDRDYKEQAALFAQGRESWGAINDLRKLAGMPPILSEAEAKRKVTWTMNSKHVVNLDDERLDNDKSRAFDFAILKPDRSVSWDVKADVDGDGVSDYKECALIGESLGLISGMNFKNKDYPHLELPS